MRQILFNGVYYPIHSDVQQRRINPWKAKLGASGAGLTYADFSSADVEEYVDFRNGIGRKRGVGSDYRLDFSEGIDFSVDGQAVLGPLVTTAGSFGTAPIKIIDFQSKTYALGDFLIGEWNTSTLAWDGMEDFTTYTEVDANSKLTVIATKATGFNADSDEDIYLYKDKGADHFDALDIDFALFIEADSGVNAYCGVAITNTIGTIQGFASTDLAVVAQEAAGPAWSIRLVRGAVVAEDFYTCSSNTLYYCTLSRTAGSDTATVKIYSDAARTSLVDTLSLSGFSTTKYQYIYGFVNRNNSGTGTDFRGYVQYLRIGSGGWGLVSPIDAIVVTDSTDSYLVVSSATAAVYTTDGNVWLGLTGCQGYLAWYDTKLRGIDTDGNTLRSSAANNVDGVWTNFSLTGHFGTVYDLFEGKLLADGTPILYFCGTEGLFTIDTTNEKAYKQEVAYPPLTYAGHVGAYWNANVWVATGYGILKVAPSAATYVGPDQDDGLPSGYIGTIYDFATVNNWLVFCVNGGTTDRSSILKRNATLGGNLDVYTCGCHEAADTTDTIGATDASDQSTLETLLNEIKTDYNTHIASTTYHVAADITNAVTSANASTLATALTLVNEIKADYNAHRILSGVHLGNDSNNDISSTDATDLATAITLANEIKVDFNLHLLSVGGAIACIHHSPSSIYTNGRLWFGEGTNVKYMMMPDTTHNVKQIATYEYIDDSGYGKLPIFRKLAAIPKTALGVAAITKSCDATEKIEVYYGLNGATPTTLLGTFIDAPKPTTLTFNSGLGTAFYTIQLAVKLYRDATVTNSPELESLLFYYFATPTRISAWQFNVIADGDDSQEIFEAFETIFDTATLVAFYPSGDPNKTSYNVKLTQMPSRSWWEEQGAREGQFTVIVEEIFSA